MVRGMDSSDLFTRLPERLFVPLTGENKRLYWGILSKLYDDFFAEDVLLSGIGIPKHDIIDSIDRYMLELPSYIKCNDDDEDKDLSGDLKQVKSRIYRRLVITGWLSIERESYNEYIILDPLVAQLIANLTDLANKNPSYFGGKVQSIYNTVKQSCEEPEEQALAFHEVAKSTKDFSRSLNAIVVRIRDIHNNVRGTSSTNDTLKAFFDDFVSNILIADYKNLKTVNHPFRYRFEILEKAQLIQLDDELRLRFIAGYSEKMGLNKFDAEQRFEKDISTITAVFSNVDRQLQRIDEIKYKLEARVNNMIRFMGKSSDSISLEIENLITSLVEAKNSNHLDKVVTPFVHGEFLSEERLYKVKQGTLEPKSRVIRKTKNSYQMSLRAKLTREAHRRRHVSQDQLLFYIARHMVNARVISSDQLIINSIEDYCMFTMLSHVALKKEYFEEKWPDFLKKYDLKYSSEDQIENEYLYSKRIIITQKGEEIC